eukprot:6005866-Amphidinium_carterae.1
MRNLRIIRRILIALIGTLGPAEAEKFWKWEPGFGYQYNGKITSEAQTISFRAAIASSPMEMYTPRMSYEDPPSGGVRRFVGPHNRAASAGSLNKPRSPKPQRASSRTRRGESRSARRQRQEEADQEPQGGDDREDRDPGDQVDFSAEEAIPEEPPENEEEGFHDDEVVPLYAERTDALEERVTAKYSQRPLDPNCLSRCRLGGTCC